MEADPDSPVGVGAVFACWLLIRLQDEVGSSVDRSATVSVDANLTERVTESEDRCWDTVARSGEGVGRSAEDDVANPDDVSGGISHCSVRGCLRRSRSVVPRVVELVLG